MSATLTAARPRRKSATKPAREPHWAVRFEWPIPDVVWVAWREILEKRAELVAMLGKFHDVATDAGLDDAAQVASAAVVPVLEAIDPIYSGLY